MIWGGGGGKIEHGIIFSAVKPFQIYFSWGRPFEIYFFPGEGLLRFIFCGEGPPKFSFLNFLRPQIINGYPLRVFLIEIRDKTSMSGHHYECHSKDIIVYFQLFSEWILLWISFNGNCHHTSIYGIYVWVIRCNSIMGKARHWQFHNCSVLYSAILLSQT